jgi:hypothetical protein
MRRGFERSCRCSSPPRPISKPSPPWWTAERGARRVRTTVINTRDTLIAWYERRGYVRTGEIQPFPYGDDRSGKPSREDLCFVVLEKAV